MHVLNRVKIPDTPKSRRESDWFDFRQLIHRFRSRVFLIMTVTNFFLFPAFIRKAGRETAGRCRNHIISCREFRVLFWADDTLILSDIPRAVHAKAV